MTIYVLKWLPEQTNEGLFSQLRRYQRFRPQTLSVTSRQVGFENGYFFSFFHIPNESILVLDFIDRIRRHFRTFRANFGADEKKLMAIQSVSGDFGKLIDGMHP